ncbi:MAG TPA: TVP38/TMEM64 family protein [Dehalococcoidia bacterium]|nr:TVP38/TMEM64 family protein [Dehalococcoidia bacterium]
MRPEKNAIYLALGMLGASAALSLGLGGLLHSAFHFSVHDIRRLVRSFGPFGAPAVSVMIAVIIVFVPIPTIPIEVVAGVAYGIVAGTALVLLGHILGALIAFLIARKFGRPLLRRWLGDGAVRKLDPFAAQSGFWYVFFMRLLPLFDFKLVSYAVGLTPMRTRTYLVATTTGIALPILILDTIGATAAARPREAAIIAAAYSLVVAGTIAYFLVPRRKRVVHVHVEHPADAPVVRFAGHLRERGHEVPAGALVAAQLNGTVLASAQTHDTGLYVLDMCLAGHCGGTGTPIAFTVNGRPAEQIVALPEHAGTIALDLSVAEAGRGQRRFRRTSAARGAVRGELA